MVPQGSRLPLGRRQVSALLLIAPWITDMAWLDAKFAGGQINAQLAAQT